jgi:two-component system, chemotaxis family, sensor kinase CheA
MKEDELKEIFLAEALESSEQLNRYFTVLERNNTDIQAIEAIFRITHTLKANAAAMGYEGIAELSHLLEDIFSIIKKKSHLLDSQIFNDLFRANDKLNELIKSVRTNAKVSYKGIATKLKVILNSQLSVTSEQLPVNNGQQNNTAENQEQFNNHNNEQETTNKKQEIINIEQETTLIQVPIKKLDNLLNLIGELIIERDRLLLKNTNDHQRKNEFSSLYRLTSDLQYAVMNVRLVQINLMFSKFYRIVRDVAVLEDKKVDLELEGTEIEIDRNVLQIISDSMIHLVRNAVSHGIEPENERLSKGKNAVGTVKLHAKNERDSVVIDIIDDGKGIDANIIRKKLISKQFVSEEIANQLTDNEVINYIFESGFSSADQVSAVSGRGVGMDVVKNAVNSIGGKISLATEVGKGTTFSLQLPTSMAVKSVLLFEVSGQPYAIPIVFTEAVISFKKEELVFLGKSLVVNHAETTVPLIFLQDLIGSKALEDYQKNRLTQQSYQNLLENQKIYVILLTFGNRQVGLIVDRLIQQKEIVEKPLKYPLDNHALMSGATIMGNGNVCLVIDVPSLINILFKKS